MYDVCMCGDQKQSLWHQFSFCLYMVLGLNPGLPIEPAQFYILLVPVSTEIGYLFLCIITICKYVMQLYKKH